MNLHKGCMSPGGTILASRRFVVTAACAAVLQAAAPALAAEDEQFMRMALDEARHGDLPYSTVIVRDGQVIARAKFGPDE